MSKILIDYARRITQKNIICLCDKTQRLEKSLEPLRELLTPDQVRAVCDGVRALPEGQDVFFLHLPQKKGFLKISVLQYKISKGLEREGLRGVGSRVCKLAAQDLAKEIAVLGFPEEFSDAAGAQAVVEGIGLSMYRYEVYRSKPTKAIQPRFVFVGDLKFSKEAVRRAQTLIEATSLARDLINTPPRDCSPASLVKAARDVAKGKGIRVDVFAKPQLKKISANLILAVSQGSDRDPYLIRMTYKPRKKTKGSKKIAIVGKGVTFDSGGLCIKDGPGMYDMKIDMSGAAAVISAMKAIAEIRPSREVVAYIPTVENMTGPAAMKPGDVFRAVNGKTVEVLNTDAEGRLILADALSLAVKDGCQEIVDIATLTGACVVALGSEVAGCLSNDDAFAVRVLAAAEAAGEDLWRLPLVDAYRAQLKSPVADLKNIGNGREGGAIIGALFLEEFVGKVPWAHLDIAGPAAREREKRYLPAGGTGFGVRTLVELCCR